MILTPTDILRIIKDRPNGPLIDKAVEYSKKMRLHIYGDGKETHLKDKGMHTFEKPTMQELRAKYAKSNKDIMARLCRPLDKVFSAKGGSVYYNLGAEQDKRARVMASEVTESYGLKAWIEHHWKPHFLDDPNGIILMEILDDPAKIVRYKAANRPIAYPTYVSIFDIHDYEPTGARFEYIVLILKAADKARFGYKPADRVYRVIDDAKDYIVKYEDGANGAGPSITVDSLLTMPNYFQSVPAISNSDIPDPLKGGLKISILDEVIELADEFMLKGSIKLTHGFLHGFPKYWEYADDCPVCHGTAHIDGQECKACGGSGKSFMSKVSDVKLLTYPQTNTDPTITPDVAGYVTPPKDFWEMATSDLKMLEDLMAYTLWGVADTPKTEGMSAGQKGEVKTATEIVADIKPQADRLHPITKQAERRHKFILDNMIRIQFGLAQYPGSFVHYGTRYMLEGPDAIWDKYQKARNSGAAAGVLDDMLHEYYEAKYDSDPVKLEIQKKLTKVEPFVHHTALQLKALMPSEEDYKAKLYFSEWLALQNEAVLLTSDVAALKESLTTYVQPKQLPQPEPKPVPAAA